MRLTTFIAGAALVALCSGPAAAATKAASVAPPSKPIPYAQLDAYLKASPKIKATKDWWADTPVATAAADTGATADTAAVTPEATATSPMTVNPSAGTTGSATTDMSAGANVQPGQAEETKPAATTTPK